MRSKDKLHAELPVNLKIRADDDKMPRDTCLYEVKPHTEWNADGHTSFSLAKSSLNTRRPPHVLNTCLSCRATETREKATSVAQQYYDQHVGTTRTTQCVWDGAPSWVGIELSPNRQVRTPAQRTNFINASKNMIFYPTCCIFLFFGTE